jgi:hypothetical protein
LLLKLANTLLLGGQRLADPGTTQLFGFLLLNPAAHRGITDVQITTHLADAHALILDHPGDFQLKADIEASVLLAHGDSSVGVVSPIEVSGAIKPAQIRLCRKGGSTNM